MIASTFTLAALAGFSAVQAIPLPQLATVEASLSTPNTTQYNASVVNYEMNGNAGACGWYNEDSDLVVGLPNEFYEDLSSVSAYCGKFVVVVDPRDNNTITALVADASTGNDTLSLSQGTWNALNGTATALKYVDWRFANETETAEANAALESGSSSSAAPSSTSYSASSSTSYSAPSSSSAAQQQQQEAVVSTSTKQSTTTSAKPTTTTEAYKAPTTTSYAPKTTTTTSAPKTTTTQAQTTTQQTSSSSSSGSYSGQATYYSQGGAAGSCGNVASDSDYVVAVNAAQMNSGWCGRTVKVTNTANGKSITATVADTCPGCSYGSLDLSIGAFGAIGAYDTGVLPISWSFA